MARALFLLIAILFAAPGRAEPLGRLFLSPDERAMLNRQRHDGRDASAAAGRVALNGLVRRSSGKTTVWINQRPQDDNESPQGVTVLKSSTGTAAVPLQLPSGKKVDLKVGQTLDIGNETVREGDAATAGRIR